MSFTVFGDLGSGAFSAEAVLAEAGPFERGTRGMASSIGLGLALARPDLRVFVLDGDGSLLMNLGSLATIGSTTPANLVLIVWDNQDYGTTGGQPTAELLLAGLPQRLGQLGLDQAGGDGILDDGPPLGPYPLRMTFDGRLVQGPGVGGGADGGRVVHGPSRIGSIGSESIVPRPYPAGEETGPSRPPIGPGADRGGDTVAFRRGPLAQLVAHLHDAQGVTGSSPVRPTTVMSQLFWDLRTLRRYL